MGGVSFEDEYPITFSQFSRQYSALLNDEYEAIKRSHPDILEQDDARITQLKEQFPGHYASLAAIMNLDGLIND